ncbi:MAG: hypothetical protein QOK44_2625, partial [Betaproteobacteria bacterium]|nr:hypothetical protein [Betaproteobacteria bacterium]
MLEGNGGVSANSALDALCRIYGVASEYKDIWGRTQRASDKTRTAILKALGALDDAADFNAALRAHEARLWRRTLP